MMNLLNKYKNNSSQLSRTEYTLAKQIDDFLKNNNLEPGKDIKPAVVDYSSVQVGNANQTVDNEEKNIQKEDEKQRRRLMMHRNRLLKKG